MTVVVTLTAQIRTDAAIIEALQALFGDGRNSPVPRSASV